MNAPCAAQYLRQAHAPAASDACAMCFHRRSCLPSVLGDLAPAALRDVLGPPQRVAKGMRLVVAGQAAPRVFIVHNGAFKSLVGVADGRQRIVGFQEAGDWLGLEGLSGVYRADVVALEHSQVCEVDLLHLEDLAGRTPALQRYLCRAMAQALVHAQGQQFALGSMHVRERLVRFLLDLSQRYAQRGLAPAEFTLRMSREDIGDYLGFRLETVSRVFTELHRAGLIELARRRVRIIDRGALDGLLDTGAPAVVRPAVAPASSRTLRDGGLRMARAAAPQASRASAVGG